MSSALLMAALFAGAVASNVHGEQATDATDATDATALYMYDDPPLLLRCLWIAGSVCAVLAIGISIYNIKQHAACAALQGFGQDELISSFGARVSCVQTAVSTVRLSCVSSLILFCCCLQQSCLNVPGKPHHEVAAYALDLFRDGRRADVLARCCRASLPAAHMSAGLINERDH